MIAGYFQRIFVVPLESYYDLSEPIDIQPTENNKVVFKLSFN